MITTAGLWVSHPKLMLERAGGMTILERQLWTLASAGIKKVVVATRQPDPAAFSSLRLPQGLEIAWLRPRTDETGGGSLAGVEPPYISISGDHFVRIETLRYVLNAPYRTHVSFTDSMDLSVLQIVPFKTEDMVRSQKALLPAGSYIFIEATQLRDGPPMDWLLALGFKCQDGFMARHFDRHISLAITRAIIETRITPNMMTVVSCLFGVAGAALFVFSPACDIVAAALVWLHSVLDGCDGEMARIRFQESTVGGDIDFWGDNLVHVSLFACLAVGMARAGHVIAPLLGSAAVVGIIGSATLAFRNRVRQRRQPCAGEPPTLLARIETILAQRDFIYLLLVMALFDLTYYFLWAGAVGAPLFLALMLGAWKTSDAADPHAAAKTPGEAT